MDPKRILITRTDRLGDVVLSTPVIRAVRRAYPSAYIAFMVRPENKDVVIHNPDLDEVVIYDKNGSRRSFLQTLLFALSLRKKRFDTALALHPENRTHIIMFFAGVPRRIGYDRKLPWLLTKKIPHRKQVGDKHEVDYNLDMARKAGFEIGEADRIPYIVTSDKDKKMIDATLKTCGISGDIIAFHVGASCPSKRWPVERFAEVADELYTKYKCDIVLVGGDDTEELSGRMTSLMRSKAVDLTGALLLGELAEFLSRCRLFISNDSGPVHVAAAVGTPVISLFGRKDPGLSPKRWGPVGGSGKVLHKDAGCDECRAHECEKGFKCLQAVTARDVVDAAAEIFYSR